MTRAMQIIPVLDLRAGIVVQARRGQHSEYAPLRSSLVQGCEPVAGAPTPQRAAVLARVGVARNVVGTQSIGPGALPRGLFAMSAPPLVLSVDLHDGRLISPDRAE